MQVLDEDNDEVLVDLIEVGQCVMLVKGGDGGKGNVCFKLFINQVFCKLILGWLGEECWFWLCFKLIVDVGLVGLFNVGKLIFLSVVSCVNLKIVVYLFMMFYFNFGVVDLGLGLCFIVVDILGLIEGVYEGVGIGDCFLGYIECCVFLIYLIDGIQEDLVVVYYMVCKELLVYGGGFESKVEIIVFNKIDVMIDEDVFECVQVFFEVIDQLVV